MSNSSANTTAANILNDNTSDDNTVPSNSSPYNKHCTSKPTTPSNRSLKRLIPADDPVACESRSQFSLLSYNVLSYKCVSPDSPAFISKSSEKLDWTHRRERILALLKRSQADVICLQEVETPTFDEDFGDDLADFGYSYVVQKQKKKNSKTRAPHTTGVATLFRSSKFRCAWENHRSRALLLGLRQIRSSDNEDVEHSASSISDVEPAMEETESKDNSIQEDFIYVANCHLEGHPSVENIRFNQLRSLFTQLELHQKQQKKECRNGRVIVCGDFNCCKDSRVYELMSTGKLDGGCTDRFYPEVVITEKDYSHPFAFRHAYEDLSEQYATYARSPGWSTIDFIWYSHESLDNVATREVISPLKMTELIRGGSGIPNLEQPSDHMPIAAVFQLK